MEVLSHYRIVKQLGAGGMGVVYLAHDERLDRDVAIKMLPARSSGDEDAQKRFRREALSLARLNHPNIATIFDFDSDQEREFLVMEFVSGVTLARRLHSEVLDEAQKIAIAKQVAGAVAAAHDRGIVHRDLKPGNVMINDSGLVKVLDFGLARLTEIGDAAVTQSLSEVRGAAGTLPYMAPEVVLGKTADPRTDIWSMGIMLLEMETGKLPFAGESTFEITSAILEGKPAIIARTLQSPLRSIVMRCLAKNPDERFRNGRELQIALEQMDAAQGTRITRRFAGRWSWAWVGLAITMLILLAGWDFVRIERAKELDAGPTAKQIAIIPTELLTGDPETASLERGLAQTLATKLNELSIGHALQVVPTSEIISKRITSLEQARQEFGVTLGIELSMRRAGQMIRVNYSLVDARNHRQIRGDTVTAPATDTFGLEDRVTESVVKALRIGLQPQEQRSLVQHGTDTPEAYDFYLQGLGYLQEYQKPENIESAITVFERALTLDPKYSLAYSGLGQAYWRKYQLDKNSSWVKEAETACNQALKIDEKQSDGHLCLGLVWNGTGHYEEAAAQLRDSIALNPTSDEAIRELASSYAKLGKTADAETLFRSAIAARPNYWRGYNSLGGLYWTEGNYARAAEMFSRVTALAPDSFRGYSNLGGVYVRLGRYSDAVAAFRQSLAIRPTSDAYSNLGTAYFHLRQYRDAAANYKAAAALKDADYVIWGNLGDAYHYSGTDEAEAQKAYTKAIQLAKNQLDVNPNDASVLSDLSGYYSMVNDRPNALQYLDRALKTTSGKDPDILFEAALVHNQFGEKRVAIEWLSKAIGSGYSPSTINDAPALNNLRSDPEFQKLLTQKPQA